jgi:hypothetical protein
MIDAFEKKAAAFAPDLVLMVAHTTDYKWLDRDLSNAVRKRLTITEPFLLDIIARARITPRTHPAIATDRLRPHRVALVEWAYARLAASIKDTGATAAAAMVPLPTELPINADTVANQTAAMRKAGFLTWDLSHIYDGVAPSSLMLTEPWQHSNAAAHARIAAAVFDRLVSDPDLHLSVPGARTRAAD